MSRLRQILMLVMLLLSSWLGMMAVHELGHVLAAWLTGAKVEKVILHPLAFSQTVVGHNPHALEEIAAGPLMGVLLPLLLALFLEWGRVAWAYLFTFFAGFCLIANGAYLGLGWLEPAGDAHDLQVHGLPITVMLTFGFITISLGFFLFHRASHRLGFGEERHPIQKTHLVVVTLVTVILYATGFLANLR